MNRSSAGNYGNLRTKKELQVVKDDLRSQFDAASFFCNLLAEQENCWRKIRNLRYEIELNPEDLAKLLKLAKVYSEAGEIMLADYTYQRAMQTRPDDVGIQLKLARMYAEAQLWEPASEQIQKACQTFPDNPDVKALKADIDSSISNIMKRVNEAWKQGDKTRSQSLLNEYLLLRPEDEEANQFKRVLSGNDLKIAPELAAICPEASSSTQFDYLLAKAAEHISNLEFERAVGIIEGLIESFPNSAFGLREKIGDIRRLQKDPPSAVWNYKQALKVVPQASEIGVKIDRARKEISENGSRLFAAEPRRTAKRQIARCVRNGA
jgi:tetratricopeptide (TPR) repeat protein